MHTILFLSFLQCVAIYAFSKSAHCILSLLYLRIIPSLHIVNKLIEYYLPLCILSLSVFAYIIYLASSKYLFWYIIYLAIPTYILTYLPIYTISHLCLLLICPYLCLCLCIASIIIWAYEFWNIIQEDDWTQFWLLLTSVYASRIWAVENISKNVSKIGRSYSSTPTAQRSNRSFYSTYYS